jgi:hypothetical protein
MRRVRTSPGVGIEPPRRAMAAVRHRGAARMATRTRAQGGASASERLYRQNATSRLLRHSPPRPRISHACRERRCDSGEARAGAAPAWRVSAQRKEHFRVRSLAAAAAAAMAQQLGAYLSEAATAVARQDGRALAALLAVDAPRPAAAVAAALRTDPRLDLAALASQRLPPPYDEARARARAAARQRPRCTRMHSRKP